MTSDIRLHNAILTSIQRSWWLVAVLLVLMSGFRLVFTIQFAHPEVWADFLHSLPVAFGFGVLHDLRILMLFALPSTLSLMWMRNRTLRSWHRWLLWTSAYWTFGISVILIGLAADQIYYSHFQSHFNILAFGAIDDDLGAVLRGAWQRHPLLLYILIGLLLEYLVFRIIRRAFHFTDFFHVAHRPKAEVADRALNRHLSVHVVLTVMLCSTPLTPLFVDLQERFPQTAFVRAVPENALEKLAETVWLRIAEEPLSVARKLGYGEDPQDALEDYFQGEVGATEGPLLERFPVREFLPQVELETRPHVVLVVMESFATHLLQYQSQDFDLLGPAQRHFDRGLLYRRFLPADNISAGSVLSLCLNQPYRPGTRQLSQSELKTMPHLTSTALRFREQGYDTAFYYGGRKDWRELDTYLPLQGFDQTIGQVEIAGLYGLDIEKDGGPWGLWDEHLFRAVEDRLRQAERPLFLVVFTTTNHPPHGLPTGTDPEPLQPPTELLQRVDQLDEKQHRQLATYRYASHKLGHWLDRMEETNHLDNMVVGVTGDHTAGMSIPFSHQEVLMERAVPFLLLLPDAIRQQVGEEVNIPGSHKDIPPTLLHAAGLLKDGYRGFGNSLLDLRQAHLGFNASGLVLFPDGAVRMHAEGFDSMEWVGDSLLLRPAESTPAAESAAERYQAALSLTDWLLYDF